MSAVNYQVVEGKNTGELAIQIIDPPYDGVIIKIGKIAVNEEESGNATLAFDYDIIKGDPESIGDADSFGQIVGDIIVDILENQVSTQEDDDGNDREDDSSQFDSE